MWSKLLSIVLILAYTSLSTSFVAGADTKPLEHCNAKCQHRFKTALASESEQWVDANVAETPFYANPANISEYAAGDLVKWENLTPHQVSHNWTIPAGMSLSRFLYMSEDIDGKPIPATAFALLPYSSPLGSNEPLRTVAWAHGTAGGTRQCAPSNHRALYYEWEAPFALAQQGYAIIAPDYAGQGSDIPQGFMYESGALHAGDVTFSLVAARKALQGLITHEWVVVGHSEGGLTAWRTNEREARKNKAIGAKGGKVGDVVSIIFLQSLARLFPSIRVDDYVTDIVAARIPLSNQGCLSTGAVLFESLTKDQLYKNTSWLTDPVVVDWQKRYNGAGPHPLAAPMLIVQGVNDTITYADFTEHDMNLTCEAFPESQAELLLYPGLDHDPAFQASQADYFSWIRDRFNNRKVKTSCSKRVAHPLTSRFSFIQQVWTADVQHD